MENLAAFGITRATIRYWGQQLAIGYRIVAINLALLLFTLTVIAPEARVWFVFFSSGVGPAREGRPYAD